MRERLEAMTPASDVPHDGMWARHVHRDRGPPAAPPCPNGRTQIELLAMHSIPTSNLRLLKQLIAAAHISYERRWPARALLGVS